MGEMDKVSERLWRFLKGALSRLGRVELTARRVVEGTLTGRHKSPFKGFSLEFAEHRPYFPGDDLRYLDWKVLAKSDKLFVRQFEQETNLRCYLLLDISGSMAYQGKGMSKLEYGVRLGALLTYLILRQGDAIGLAIFSDRLIRFIPARRSLPHLSVILNALGSVRPEGQTHFRRVMEELSPHLKRRSLLVLLSDLLDEGRALSRALHYLRHRGHEVLVMHLLDPDELTFPFSLPTTFIDLETRTPLPVDPESLRDAYRERVTAFLGACRKACGQAGAHYALFTTDRQVTEALGHYLAWRSRRLF